MNLLFCVNKKLESLFLNCIRSITANGGYDRYDAYVLHSDFDKTYIEMLENTFNGTVYFHFIEMSNDMFNGFPETERYPKEIYYRLAAPLVLPQELDRILYLDVDTVVINPLKELYEMEFDGNYYIGCTHTRKFLTKINQMRLQSPKAVSYINSGVLLLNLPLLRENLDFKEICDYANKRKNSLILPDQDILTALYGDKVKVVDTLRYNLSDRILVVYNADLSHKKIDVSWVRENGVIIHYCGKNKPWKDNYVGTLGVFYQESKQCE